jgi:hypothetical protein
LIWVTSFSQKDESETRELDEVYYENNYQAKYNRQLRRVRRVYPLALKAAELINEIDLQLENEDSNRKKKKITKKYQKELKSNYVFAIKDLYIEEGKLLMKLIHRETGMTTAQIIAKYKGRFKSELYDQMGKIWDQDLDATYDPTGKDWLTEIVIRDVLSKEVSFEPEAKKLTKEEYKLSIQEYKASKKAARKLMREKRRAASDAEKKED